MANVTFIIFQLLNENSRNHTALKHAILVMPYTLLAPIQHTELP